VSDNPRFGRVIYTSASTPYTPAPEPVELPEPWPHESNLIRTPVEHARMHAIPEARLPAELRGVIERFDLHLEAERAGLHRSDEHRKTRA
jgi:hypothetical protein